MSKSIWAGRVISVLAVLPFALGAVMKLSGGAQVAQGFEHLGWPIPMIARIGVMELACALIYLVPATSALGAILLTGFIGGAIATHLRIGEPIVVQVIIGVLIWLGLFLRESRFADLLPVRSKDFRYEREVTIQRARDEVFAYLKPLDNFRNWNPFLRSDPNVRIETRGIDGQVGYVAAWEGNREVGSGEQEIARVIDGERVEFELRFKKPFAATNRAYFSTEDLGGNRTRVRWGMTGKTVFPMSVFCIFMKMDKMIGDQFDWGLNKLKTILEK